MFVACGIWCLADVSSVSPSSEQTALRLGKFVTVTIVVYSTIVLAVPITL